MRSRTTVLIHGMSIFTGHWFTHRLHPVQRSLNSAALSCPWTPASQPVAMPPEYVSPPNACPPTCWKFAHEFAHAEHRMQYSVSRLVVLAHLHPTVVDEHEVELAVVAGFKLSLAEGR